MKPVHLSYSMMSMLEDPQTDHRMLPPGLRRSDNERRVRHYKIALNKAMDNCLTPVQKEQLQLHYWGGLTKSEIAKRQNKGCSAITKSMRAGEEAVRTYIEQYMDIYDALEKEWLDEE